MSENILIHVGQAGCQIGNCLWELFLMENGIGPDGYLLDPKTKNLYHDGTFFERDSENHYTPRSLFVDVDPTSVDSIKNQHSRIYNPENFISGTQDKTFNYNSDGGEIINNVMERLRKLCEECYSSRKVFWMFHSLNGATGSALGSLILDEINTEYKCSSSKFQVAVIPDINLLTPTDCYNSILSLNSTIESVNMSFYFSNNKIASIFQTEFPYKGTVPYTNINRHISIALACLTATSRQKWARDINDHIGISVFPRLHYPLISYYPTSTIRMRYKESPSVRDLTVNCFKGENFVLDLDPSSGYYINANLFYRGDVSPSEVVGSVKHIDDTVELLDWTPAGLKLFYNDHSRFLSPERDLLRIDRSICMLAEHTIFKEYLKGLTGNLGATFRDKPTLDRYKREGMEEGDINNAKENVESVIEEFESLI